MIDSALLAQVTTLSAEDRLELIGAVWESLETKDIPVAEAERAILDARIDDEIKNPLDVSPWPEVEARLRRRLR